MTSQHGKTHPLSDLIYSFSIQNNHGLGSMSCVRSIDFRLVRRGEPSVLCEVYQPLTSVCAVQQCQELSVFTHNYIFLGKS